jgi:hypothetical protein
MSSPARLCKCGGRAVSYDGLCKECVFIREALQRELKWKRRYDRRFKTGGHTGRKAEAKG